MDQITIQKLQDQGLSASQIDSIAEASAAMERRHEEAIDRRAAEARQSRLEDQQWERQQAWLRQQDATASAQSRRAGR
jgi:hypothetical protein